MKKWENINLLCDIVRTTSLAIHRYHRSGHLEKIYENALAHRLRKQGLEAKQQHPLTVFDEDGTVLGDFYADIFVEDCLLVELKACRAIADEHVAHRDGTADQLWRTETLRQKISDDLTMKIPPLRASLCLFVANLLEN